MPDNDLLPPLNATDDPLFATVRAIAFDLLLRTGHPITVDDLGLAGGIAFAETGRSIDVLVAAGRVTVDDRGAVTGSLGLSVLETRHRLELAEGVRYTWCALDALGICGALGVSGRIVSTTVDNQRVQIEFADGIPVGSAELAVLLPKRTPGPTVLCWCPLVNFFTSTEHALAWSCANDTPGDVIALPELAELGTRLWRDAIAARYGLGDRLITDEQG